MGRQLTPEEMRAYAAHARREAARLAALADDMDDLAAKGLTIDEERAIVRHNMQAPPAPVRPHRQLGRPSKVKHPFRTYLDSIEWTVADWASVKDEHPSTVKAWMRGDRKIPEARAIQIENEAGLDAKGKPRVPATVAIWRGGIK